MLRDIYAYPSFAFYISLDSWLSCEDVINLELNCGVLVRPQQGRNTYFCLLYTIKNHLIISGMQIILAEEIQSD